jgi:phosphoribosylformylglycinamidine (FGAM) synthase PurS component
LTGSDSENGGKEAKADVDASRQDGETVTEVNDVNNGKEADIEIDGEEYDNDDELVKDMETSEGA